MDQITFSIVVPTYNEEKDIAQTLNSLVNLSYKNKEILVVDDSNDNTPKIVLSYEDMGVRLIVPPKRMGRCEARNIGIREARGEVIVILNADVILPRDFLERLSVHYAAGYDSVTVSSRVLNLHAPYSRYIFLLDKMKAETGVYKRRAISDNGIYWSEGFSVKRSIALKTSLFPTGYCLPIEAGEDVNFVDELRALGCQGIVDESLVVLHVAPDNLHEYWSVRKGRGAGTPQIRRFINRWSYKKITTVLIIKASLRLIRIITIVPMLTYNYKLAYYSDKPRLAETLLLSWCWLVEQIAFSVGEFQSLKKIWTKES